MKRPILSVKAPATSANLGSGFDAIGMALSLYNVFDLMDLLPEGEFKVEAIGEGANLISESRAEDNCLIRSYLSACDALGAPRRGLWVRCHNAIPFSRGLGSSATAVVAGALMAWELSGRKAQREELLRIMVAMEGHPDNVVPCVTGGVVVSCVVDNGELKYIKLPQPPKDLVAVVAVPEVLVNTEEARRALPNTVRLEDAVFNLGRAALLAAAWSVGRFDLLSFGMDDRLHQSYRSRLFPGGDVIMDRVKSVPGCLGVAISGSGPSVIALVKGSPSLVAQAMCGTFMEHGVRSRFFVLDCPASGAEARTLSGR